MNPASTPSKPRMRRSRQEMQAQTREKLLEVATRLFVEKGYGGTSLRDIAEQAGFTQGAFYSNFESKEALLLEMLRRHMQREALQLAELVGNANKGMEHVLDDLQSWASTIDTDVAWSMLSIELQLHAQRSTVFAQAYQAVWEEHKAVLAHWIEKIFAGYKAQMPAKAESMASALMALAHGLALQRAATGAGASGSVIALMLRGLVALGREEVKPIASMSTVRRSKTKRA